MSESQSWEFLADSTHVLAGHRVLLAQSPVDLTGEDY